MSSRSADQVDASPVDGRRLCEWCGGPIPATARRDARYCGVLHRQAAHRFGRGRRVVPLEFEGSRSLRLCYADPPYDELSAKYYRDHPDFAGEVDSCALVGRLLDEFPDGWALSCSARSLPKIMKVCPDEVRVCAWTKGARAPRYQPLNPLSSWEPVIVYGCRPQPSRSPGEHVVDTLVHGVRPRLTDPKRVTGAKPAAFIWWLFDLMGLLPGDELVDLFPGSGGVTRAWELFNAPDVLRSAAAEPDASGDAGGARRVVEDLHDALPPGPGDAVTTVEPDASRTARAEASCRPADETRRLEHLDDQRAEVEARHDAALTDAIERVESWRGAS